MKATGIVRRIDELGRIVIPKELRRTLHIREGDPLEIFTERDGTVIFKKYSPMGELTEFAGRICEALHKNTGFLAAVCDRDTVIAAAGPERQALAERRLTAGLRRRLEERERCCPGGRGAPMAMAEGADAVLGAAAPIVSEGELLGGVLLGADPARGRWPGDFELRLLDVVAGFLGRQMEG
ncbi:MAG: AbrB/MazE/SpoVT family DNA-binding domain-containing protein [Oscillospiraceae bacterium]|nr:AbrB/MazE/SpoVT family DNA-binding domain-containing protein [Oscillospiraceae bacterium]MBR7009665.1 AbrB/MazE/SpoVT family DNA-binding domain-containing protein [Oscillospiraceae bacterium]